MFDNLLSDVKKRAPWRRVSLRLVWFLVIVLVAAGTGIARADVPDASSAASLRARYAASQDRLSNNQFHRPIYLDSTQSSSDLKGDIHAVVEYPFATVNAALKGATQWCDILILHLNVKYCRASPGASGTSLAVYIGRKFDQPLEAAHRVDFSYRVATETSDYLQVLLAADIGPFGTKNYRIMVEAVPLEGRTFLHLSYSYAYGTTARLAMQAYLNTFGSDKVGFTVIGNRSDGQPIYVGDVRGAVERNTIRYYLAIDAYLAAFSAPPQEQLEKRLRDWFASSERYRLQLHELEENEYLEMKRKEYRRQQQEIR